MQFLPFHRGEVAAQERAGFGGGIAPIRDFMPDQHRQFFAMLPMLPLATLDDRGAPTATILNGPPGFIASPDRQSLLVDARLDPADPVVPYLRPGAPIGLLGIDLMTRRRNRANGFLRGVEAGMLDIAVTESFGNCPQYIQLRRPVRIDAAPGLTTLPPALDAAAEALLGRADTLFVASSGGAAGGVDISHRGGRPGFLRYEDGRLTVPDFPGNRYFNTLGNFLEDPRAAVLVPDFETGALLHLAGRVELLWDAAGLVERAERAWVLHIETAWRREAALPLGWELVEYAPTSLRSGVFDKA
jgi:predicted pyridoxine 5'-phosphate oxidase superfamily flavin-nucleotide-binding protein